MVEVVLKGIYKFPILKLLHDMENFCIVLEACIDLKKF
jgi:hypothetical protein